MNKRRFPTMTILLIFLQFSLSALAQTDAAITATAPVTMMGFFRSQTSDSIRPPASEEWSFNIMMLANEGSRVKPGDIVARFEGERLKKRLNELSNELLQAKVRREQKISDLKVQLDELTKEVQDQHQELLLLKTSYDSAEKAGENTRPARDFLIDKLNIESKKLQIAAKEAKLSRKHHLLKTAQAALDRNIQSVELRLAKVQNSIAAGERHANIEGIVVYKRSSLDGQKYRVGANVYRGSEVLAIVDERNLSVEAYLREEDWQLVKPKEAVLIHILGQKDFTIPGEILDISPIVMPASDWDRTLPPNHPLLKQRVFRVRIKLKQISEEAKPDGEVLVEMSQETAS